MRSFALALSLALLSPLTACSLETAGLMEAGVTDGGPVDSGIMDSGIMDSGIMDSGTMDSGGLDAGPIDAGPPDAGSCDPDACPGRRCEGLRCSHYTSCDALHRDRGDLGTGVYELLAGGAPFEAFCEMEAEGGGWTLVLKTDGQSDLFDYADPLWTDTRLHRESSLDLSPGDAKLEAYLQVPFEELRVGLGEPGEETRWLSLRRSDGEIASMREAMMQEGTPGLARLDGSPVGYDDWVAILPGSDGELQRNCGRSAMPNPGGGGCGMICAHVRIGILGNNTGSCSTPDSYLGLGGHPSDRPAAAPSGAVSADGTERPAYGFVLVR